MTMIDISPILYSRFSLRAAIAVAGVLASATLPMPSHVAWAQDSASAELRAAVRSLANNPENVSALIDAGDAALEMGDADAAAGFFLRAEAVSPSNGRVKAGLAKAKLRQEDPVRAIALFEEAQALGQSESDFAADKGLAYDLIGDFASAQKSYRIAELYQKSPSLTLRMAISYDLTGDRDRAAQLLNPLLTDNNSGAWRAQSFLYAAHGQMDKARAVAASFLGPSRANQFDEYLEKMPRLSVAQQMAAIHFGHFPRSSYGVDNAAIAAIQQNRGITKPPQQQPQETRDEKSKARPPAFIDFRGRKQANVAYTAPVSVAAAIAAQPPPNSTPTPPPPVRQGSVNGSNSPGAALAEAGRNAAPSSNVPSAATTPTPSASSPSSQMGVIADPAQPASSPASPTPQMGVISEPAQTAPQPSPKQQVGIIAEPASQQVTPPSPSSPPSAASAGPGNLPANQPAASVASGNAPGSSVGPPQAATPLAGSLKDVPDLGQMPAGQSASQSSAPDSDARDLAALVSDISIPESEKQQDVVPVTEDLIEAENPRKADNSARTAAVPAYPARHWVQIATGSDLNALAYDFRRFARQYDALFEGKKGWTSAWGASRRLVVGPFDSFDAARAWQQDYREKGGDAFVWRSDDGTVVDPLSTR